MACLVRGGRRLSPPGMAALPDCVSEKPGNSVDSMADHLGADTGVRDVVRNDLRLPEMLIAGSAKVTPVVPAGLAVVEESNSVSPCFVSPYVTTTYRITSGRRSGYDRTTLDHPWPFEPFVDRIYCGLTGDTWRRATHRSLRLEG